LLDRFSLALYGSQDDRLAVVYLRSDEHQAVVILSKMNSHLSHGLPTTKLNMNYWCGGAQRGLQQVFVVERSVTG